MSIESGLLVRNIKSAWHRGQNFRGGPPCKVCGLFLCICQSSLLDFIEKPKVRFKRGGVCPRCGLFLCDCRVDARGVLLK